MPLQHTDREYAARLQQLREDLAHMGQVVETMIQDAVHALVQRDVALAQAVIDRDAEVNRIELECDEKCFLVLAKWQPVASDLRFLTVVLKTVTDIERMGDMAVHVAERAIRLADEEVPRPWVDTPRMGMLAREMLHDAVNAMITEDAELARQVMERDDEVDALYERVFLDVLAIMKEDSDYLQQGLHIQAIAKHLERVADHATNLAEEVIFLVQAEVVRHEGKLDE